MLIRLVYTYIKNIGLFFHGRTSSLVPSVEMIDPLAIRRSSRLSYQAMSSTSAHSQLCTPTPLSSFVRCSDFNFSHCLRQSPHLRELKSRTGNHSGMN